MLNLKMGREDILVPLIFFFQFLKFKYALPCIWTLVLIEHVKKGGLNKMGERGEGKRSEEGIDFNFRET